MISLLKNNPDVKVSFHILTDTLADASEKKLTDLANNYGSEVMFYYMDDHKLKGQKTSWSKYSWYRIFAPDVISKDIHELLYLDCDTIVTGKIHDIFNQPYSDWSFAAVPDYMTIFPSNFKRVDYPMELGYVCAGILLMNIDHFRKHNLSEKLLSFALENPFRIHFPDQDALNCVCKDTKIQLPLKYGILDPFYRDKRFILKFREEVRETLDDPRIVHYAGCAPWISESNHHYYEDEFWKYAAMITGGIRRRHCCHGYGLVSLTAKRLLGKLGMKSFKRFIPSPRPTYEQITKLLEL